MVESGMCIERETERKYNRRHGKINDGKEEEGE